MALTSSSPGASQSFRPASSPNPMFHSEMNWSAPPLASHSPSCETSSVNTAPSCGSSKASVALSESPRVRGVDSLGGGCCSSHMETHPSLSPAATRYTPSLGTRAEKATQSTASLRLISERSSPSVEPHTRTQLSSPPDASSAPSFEKARELTVVPWRISIAVPPSRQSRHTRTVRAVPAAASISPSAENTVAFTVSSICSDATFLPSGTLQRVTFLSLPPLASTVQSGDRLTLLTSPSSLSSFWRVHVSTDQYESRFPAPE
mmetsp:Transcript_2385/g.5952  ORF Transcript_2385/g.5952 Transcript_2385/m.5952 type:complete len:262 (+) Transcript_2385:841-1626(+)